MLISTHNFHVFVVENKIVLLSACSAQKWDKMIQYQ